MCRQFVCDGGYIFRRMLTVAVRGDGADDLRTVFRKPRERCFQRSAFAPVLFVSQQRYVSASGGFVVKMQPLRRGAVVYYDNILKAR